MDRAFLRPPAELSEATTTRSSVRSANHQGNLWPISYALTQLTDTEEIKIAKLVKKAVS